MTSQSDISELLAERGKTHGDYAVHAKVTQLLKLTIRQHFVGQMQLDQWETVDMICHKLGRIAAGNAEFADHWDDIAGYAKLSADEVRKRQAAQPATTTGPEPEYQTDDWPIELLQAVLRLTHDAQRSVRPWIHGFHITEGRYPTVDEVLQYNARLRYAKPV